jgi:hypothetical protein
MAGILGTWNPKKWPWDDIDEAIAATAGGNVVPVRWSVGNRKHGIALGDRFFLLKQEVEPRGIVASGTVSSLPFEDAHWNNQPGVTTNYVNVAFDVVLDPEDVLPIEQLVAELGNTHWRPQSSGTSVHPVDVGTLESMWMEHVRQV